MARLDTLSDEIRALRRVVLAFSSRPTEPAPAAPVAPALVTRLTLAAEGLGRSAGALARTGVSHTVAMSRKFTAETLAMAAALLRR